MSGRRLLAHLIDGVVFGIIFAIGAIPFALTTDLGLILYLVLGATVGQVAYYAITQRVDGQTPGKGAADIRVVDATGQTPSRAALVKRTIPLLIEYLYVIAFISMQTSAYRQRLGDRWADTYVIRASTGTAIKPPAPRMTREEIQERAAKERAERDARTA